MAEIIEKPVQPRRRNWWKIGFFVMLILFEFAREIAVVASTERAQPNVSKHIFSMGGYVAARGRWRRSDGGSEIIPGVVTIVCRKETGQCVEASVSSFSGKYFGSPELDWFDANFAADTVSYENDSALCARYAVRIDLTQKRAFATREKKPGSKDVTGAPCEILEDRVAMELGDGLSANPTPFQGHYVPLLQFTQAIFRLLDN